MDNPWTKHLTPQSPDIYSEYKNGISLSLEEIVSKTTKELLDSDPQYDVSSAKVMAINLLMEQLLELQYKNTPESQCAMVVNLFVEMPEVKKVMGADMPEAKRINPLKPNR